MFQKKTSLQRIKQETNEATNIDYRTISLENNGNIGKAKQITLTNKKNNNTPDKTLC